MYHVDFVRFCVRDDLETWVTLDKYIKLMDPCMMIIRNKVTTKKGKNPRKTRVGVLAGIFYV